MALHIDKNREQPRSRAPRGGLQLMAMIVAVMGLLAMYSQYQKLRRDKVETVVITPAVPATTAPSPSPSPAAP